VEENAAKAFHRIIWTKFAAKEMDGAGLDYDRVPYGIDTKNFHPGDKEKARETARMPQGKFIVGLVGMNKGYPPRKAFFENILAFKQFHDKHPDSYLYLHTQDGSKPNDGMVNLLYYCKRVGLELGKDVGFADQYSMLIGYSEDQMNTIYNCMDVHMLVSMGEGFGLPQVEAQACGVPVICGDWTAMPELMFSGWKVGRNECLPQYTLQNTYQFIPLVPAIVDRLEQAYKNHQSTAAKKEYSERARKGAEKYDIDRVVEKYWVPTLAKIEQKLKDAPAPELAKNLEMLR
jgi:glycosyltransferase involved in cell wall biosynthesis